MTNRNSYNEDKSYELMAHIISNEMGPYDETARADITEILRLCYVYSANAGKGYEASASDLGQAIIDLLSEGWGIPDFRAASEDFWNPTEDAPEPDVDDTPADGPLIP